MSATDIGAAKVVANLNAQISRIENVTPAGMTAGGLLIQRDAQQRVSVEYGVLRASAYTRRVPGQALAVEVGFSAAYAAKVHENLEMKLAGRPRKSGIGVYWGPAGESQFLLKAVRDKTPDVLRVIASYAQVKP